jgi:aminoglycoside phosphotransferase (APT) family kinase protein
LPIPVPRFVGTRSDRFPWPFFGASLLPGCEPADAELDDADRTELGAALGRFLRVLHSPETLAVVDSERTLPVDFNRRADMPYQAERTRRRLQELGLPVPAEAETLLAEAETLPASTSEVLVHGDLHVRHVLVDGNAIAGVIDWGDVCRGDPSIDLQIAWSLLPADARTRFFDEYGPIDEERRLRSRVFAVGICVMLALYARSVGFASLERESLAGLERAVAD